MNHLLKKRTAVIALVLIASVVFSCSKDDDSSSQPTPDVTGPLITLVYPTDGDTVSMAADSLKLRFTVYDTQGLDSLLMVVTNQSTGDTIRYLNQVLNGTLSYLYSNYYFATPFNFTYPANVYIRATDNLGNVSTKQASCLIVP